MKVAYWPGCVSRGFTPELHGSMEKIAPLLDLELVELDRASCCGAGVIAEHSPGAGRHAQRAHVRARREDRLRPDDEHLLDLPGLDDRVPGAPRREHRVPGAINDNLRDEGLKYEKAVVNKNLAWVLVEELGLDELRSRVKRPLTDLRVGPFYGCYIIRPRDRLGIDDEHPRHTYLHQIIEALGGTVIDYAGAYKCCGFPIITMNKEASLKQAGRHLGDAVDAEADCLVTPCPLCHLNLDLQQPLAEKVVGRELDMPVLHLPQLLGLALGLKPKELGLQRHVVKPTSVIDWTNAVVAGAARLGGLGLGAGRGARGPAGATSGAPGRSPASQKATRANSEAASSARLSASIWASLYSSTTLSTCLGDSPASFAACSAVSRETIWTPCSVPWTSSCATLSGISSLASTRSWNPVVRPASSTAPIKAVPSEDPRLCAAPCRPPTSLLRDSSTADIVMLPSWDTTNPTPAPKKASETPKSGEPSDGEIVDIRAMSPTKIRSRPTRTMRRGDTRSASRAPGQGGQDHRDGDRHDLHPGLQRILAQDEL